MTQTTTEVYDTVRADTLEVGDLIEVAGYACRVKEIHDEGLMGLHIDLYNEDTDEDEEGEPFGAHTMVNLIHETYKED